MGRTNGGGGGSRPPTEDNRRFMEFAERNARQAGRLADLKIGSSELFLQTTEQTRRFCFYLFLAETSDVSCIS